MLSEKLLLYAQLSKKLVYVGNMGPQNNISQTDHLLNIKVINKKEFNKLCKDKNLEAYAFEWNFFDDTGQSQGESIAVKLLNMSVDNIKKKKLIITELLTKYLDFQNIFSKIEANKLPKYNEHDMPINFENEKILFIYPVYDMSKLKRQAMHKYIDKMLTKNFVILFKSLVKVSIIFTKKKNGGLCFCIDYCNINIIIKKNKHSIPLIDSLFNMLSKA